MKMNQKIKCAMICLSELAKCPTEFLNCEQIALRQQLPVATAHKVLQRLVKAGLVVSRKSIGYQLSRPLSSISALEMLDALSEDEQVSVLLDDVTASFKSRVNKALGQVRLQEVVAR